MTHELKKIVQAYHKNQLAGQQSVLATVVALEGSSYRRPGVCMLINEMGEMTGAVSGGCVEKEVIRQAASVFVTGTAKVMTYDGRYRLGCEGILYILIEPFAPNADFLAAVNETITKRLPIQVSSYYEKDIAQNEGFGSTFLLNENWYSTHPKVSLNSKFLKLERTLAPCYRLIIVGAEHDAVQLCLFAANMGWEVIVIAHPTEEKKFTDFPGALELQGIIAEDLDVSQIDQQTAVVLMTHSYSKDLQFLIALHESRPAYLGLLGPNKRREKLLHEFLEHCPEVDDTFFEGVYGPTGLAIGAETPQEIAIAILAEILSVMRQSTPVSLREKKGEIHT